MKNKLRLSLVVFIALLSIGCEKDDCTCPDNEHEDPPVFVDEREVYVGDYLVTDSVFNGGSVGSVNQYIMSVNFDGTVEDTLYFTNYGNSNGDLFALELNGFVSIPSQAGSFGIGVSGSGSIDSLQFFLEYNEGVNHRCYGEKQE